MARSTCGRTFRTAVSILLLIFLTACNLSAPMLPTPPDSTQQPTRQQVQQQMPLVYYYFPALPGNTFPAGSVVIIADTIILSPTVTKLTPTNDVAADIRSALQAMIADPRNLWKSDQLTITSVTFDGGQAAISLTGKITGVGDVVLIAARMQFLMTIFANPSVQTAMVTLNGESIGNLGISHSGEAKSANHAYSRVEITDYMQKNAHRP
jgi:hypothetical protein